MFRLTAPTTVLVRPVAASACLRPSPFTFVEILIAVAILGLSLALAFSMIADGRSRILRGERRWAREHNLAQATEFYLLAGPDAAMPPGVLPEGFTATCELELAEDLPDLAQENIDGWVLGRYRITVRAKNGDVVAEHDLEKLVREDDLW